MMRLLDATFGVPDAEFEKNRMPAPSQLEMTLPSNVQPTVLRSKSIPSPSSLVVFVKTPLIILPVAEQPEHWPNSILTVFASRAVPILLTWFPEMVQPLPD